MTLQMMFENLNAIVYSACTCLIVTLLFYVCRPSDDEAFVEWWHRGRWALLVALSATAAAIVVTFAMSGGLLSGQW
jgi:hypothetical protein